MSKGRRIDLDWKKLFAFEQVEGRRRRAGRKDGLKVGERLHAKIGTKDGEMVIFDGVLVHGLEFESDPSRSRGKLAPDKSRRGKRTTAGKLRT